MLENLQFLSVPIVACVLMAGILSYFGNHILTRGIIFIDVALAQIAALGTMIGIFIGAAEESMLGHLESPVLLWLLQLPVLCVDRARCRLSICFSIFVLWTY